MIDGRKYRSAYGPIAAVHAALRAPLPTDWRDPNLSDAEEGENGHDDHDKADEIDDVVHFSLRGLRFTYDLNACASGGVPEAAPSWTAGREEV
jgi:hypothetical protein